MAIENKANLINQIIQSSKLQGKALEDLKSRLAQLSEAELQAELTKALSGDNFYGDMGLKVEYSNKPNSSNTVSLTNSHKTVNLTEEQAKDLSIDYISSNLQKALEITMHTNNGWISKAYDFGKNLFNTELSSKNVNDVVNKEHDCISYLIKSKEGKLTKREYYEMNKARLKEMFLNRMKNQDDTGLDAIDKYREEYSRKEFEELIDKYLTQTIDTISTMEGIKLSQHQLITATEEVEAELLEKIANEAKKNKGIAPSKSSDISNFVDIKNNPAEFHPFNSDELMTFEETYLLERGVEFSISEMEELQQAQGEMTFVTSAYNKLQGLKNSVENFKTSYEKATQEYYDEYGVVIVKGEEPNAEERKKEALDILNNYYQLNPEMAIDDLQNIINKQFLNLKLSLNEEGQLELNFNEFHQNDVSKNKSLNLLMHGLNQHQINRFNNLLSNKTIDEYISDYQKEYSEALGERNVEELAKAMEKDNIEFIDTTTGVASAAGMGLLLVGGVFVAAPVVLGSLGVAVPATLSTGVIATGANLATAVGGKIAIGGMATRNILGITEAYSREEKSQEEITRRYKDLAMDVSGFIIGSFAGATGFKNGMKAFQKGAVNKLGAKAMEVSIDASISVAGDLAMIGILDYDQDLKTTIKQNGIGILISTLTGIKTGQVYEKHNMAKAGVDNVDINDIKMGYSNPNKKINSNHWVSYNKFYESDIDKAVDDIIAHYTKSEPEIRKIINSFGFEDLGKFSARIKSDYSLRDKIKNFLKDHPSATHKDVWDEIRDCFGMRSIVKSEDYTTHPKVKKLIDAGDIKGAKIKAAELQSEPAVAKIKEIILANKKGDNRISVARITNYVSKDGIPYFSEAQLSELKQFGFDNDVEIDYVKKAAPDDIKAGEMDFDAKPTTRSQPSGYTALQMNFVTKNGDTIEWQYRGEKVDRFAEGEHIPYDLRTGKDITGGNKDLEEFYSDFKSMLINMGKDEYKAYNTYLDAYYTHLRNLELGFESTPPKLQDFAPKGYTFSHKLEAENLIKLSKIAHYLKNGKITLEIALDQYYNI